MLKILIALILPLLANAADAGDLVFRAPDGDSAYLRKAPCTAEAVLTRLSALQRETYQAASAVVDGKTFVACWGVMGSSAHLVYEDGDEGYIKLRDLKEEHPV